MSDKMKCDECGQLVPSDTTSSCIGYRLHDGEILSRLGIVKSKKSLFRICSFEGANWFCRECLDSNCFCRTCQEETTLEEREAVFEDLG